MTSESEKIGFDGRPKIRGEFLELRKMLQEKPIAVDINAYANMRKFQANTLGAFIWNLNATAEKECLLEFLRIYPDNYPEATPDGIICSDIGTMLAQVPEWEREEAYALFYDLVDSISARDSIKSMLMMLWYSPEPSAPYNERLSLKFE